MSAGGAEPDGGFKATDKWRNKILKHHLARPSPQNHTCSKPALAGYLRTITNPKRDLIDVSRSGIILPFDAQERSRMSQLREVPFIASFKPAWSDEEVDDAVCTAREAYQSYDPRTQISSIPAFAGTSRTYTSTRSGGPVIYSPDDDRVSDD